MLYRGRRRLVHDPGVCRSVSLNQRSGTLINPYAACVVSHVLESEPTIRVVVVAGRLSHSRRQPYGEDGGSLSPVLDFWLSALHKALDADVFWGPGFWEDIDTPASWLEHGLEELVRQCFELESLLPACKLDQSSSIALSAFTQEGSIVPTKLQSPLTANATTFGKHEGDHWMNRIVLGFWRTVLADAAKIEATAMLSMTHLQPMRAEFYTS